MGSIPIIQSLEADYIMQGWLLKKKRYVGHRGEGGDELEGGSGPGTPLPHITRPRCWTIVEGARGPF